MKSIVSSTLTSRTHYLRLHSDGPTAICTENPASNATNAAMSDFTRMSKYGPTAKKAEELSIPMTVDADNAAVASASENSSDIMARTIVRVAPANPRRIPSN